MLGYYYRFQIANTSGVTIAAAAATVQGKRYAFNSSGVPVWESSAAALQSNGSIANNAFDTSATYTNTTNVYLGGTIDFSVTTTGTPSGPVTLVLQRSTDNTRWPDNGKGTVIAVLNFAASGTQTTSVEI